MNSFELNKILGAVLFTCLALLGLNIAAGAVFAPVPPAKPGYAIEVKAEPTGTPGAPKEPEKPIAVLLASASVQKGEAGTKQCQACHTFTKDGPNRVGPNLYGVVGRPKGSHPGFNYSDAMKKKGGNWTFDELNNFIRNPRGDIPGTKMTFAGIGRDSQRADVIDYLHTLSESPQPLPKVAEGAPAGQPAAGAPPAAPQPGAAPAPKAGAAPAPKAVQAPTPPNAPAAAPAPAPAQGAPQGNPAGGATPQGTNPGQTTPQPGNAGAQTNAPAGAAPPKQ